MRWPIARDRGSTPASSTAPVQAAGAAARLLPITRLEAFSDAVFAIAKKLAAVWTDHGALHHSAPVSWR